MAVSAQKTDLDMARTCSIWRALEVVGDKPILIILEAVFMGNRRFGDLEKQTGLLKALLSNRLKRLVATGLLQKRQRQPGKKSYDYVLTAKGVDLFNTVLALYRWEDTWNTDRHNFQLIHDQCGNVFSPQARCGSCGEAYTLKDVEWQKGPGSGWTKNSYLRRRHQKITTTRPSLLTGSVDVLGDRWGALVMRSIFTGHHKFDEIENELSIGSAVLAGRLKRLSETGILKTQAYQDNPVRYEYFLTAKGRDYYHVIMMLMLWGDKYYASKDGPPILLKHIKCDAPLNPKQCCSQCDGELTAFTVRIARLETTG